MNTFGIILKQAIKTKGITQEEFADKVGISRTTVVKYISPKYNNYPRVEEILKMCEVLDCDSDYLLGLQPHPRKETTDICSVTGLSPAAVTALKARKQDQDNALPGEVPPGAMELKSLNHILEHGLDEEGFMNNTIFTNIGYILFSHFINAHLANTEDRKIPISGTNKHFVSPSGKDKITFYDEISGAFTEFRIEDLNLSQMENIRKSIYLLKDELDKQNRPSK